MSELLLKDYLSEDVIVDYPMLCEAMHLAEAADPGDTIMLLLPAPNHTAAKVVIKVNYM